jgi:hypothetical protein
MHVLNRVTKLVLPSGTSYRSEYPFANTASVNTGLTGTVTNL